MQRHRKTIATIARSLVAASLLAGSPAVAAGAAPMRADPQASAAPDAAARAARFEKAYRPQKHSASLEERRFALAELEGLEGERVAKALVAGHAQLLREHEALVAELFETSEKAEELREKLDEAARSRKPPRGADKSRLEKLDAELKELAAKRGDYLGLWRAIESALVTLRAPESLRWLLANLSVAQPFEPRTRERVARNAAACAPPLVAELADAVIVAKEPEDRVFALDGLAACGPAAAAQVETIAAKLHDPDEAVQEAAAFALAESSAPAALEALVRWLAEVPAGPRLRKANQALVQLAGVDFGGEAREWRAWLAADGAPLRTGAVALPVRAPRRCFDLALRGLSIAFVIDASAAMLAGAAGIEGARPGESRLDLAKREVAQAIAALPADARFTVVAYAHEPRAFAPELRLATAESVAAAHEWIGRITTVEKTVAATSTALSQLLQDLAAAPLAEGRRARLDSVVLITASGGVLPDGDREPAEQLLQLVEIRNRPVQACIDVIALGGERELLLRLRELARRTGGRYAAR